MAKPQIGVIGQAQPTFPAPLRPLGVETLTVDATSGGVSLASVPAGARYATMGPLESGAVRYWPDGTAPTSSTGKLVNVGDSIAFATNDFSQFKAIRTTSTSGSLPVAYWG